MVKRIVFVSYKYFILNVLRFVWDFKWTIFNRPTIIEEAFEENFTNVLKPSVSTPKFKNKMKSHVNNFKRINVCMQTLYCKLLCIIKLIINFNYRLRKWLKANDPDVKAFILIIKKKALNDIIVFEVFRVFSVILNTT